MEAIDKARSAFTSSGGVVACDRLSVEIDEDITITTALEYVVPHEDSITLWFADNLSAQEKSALDVIVANHSGLGIPTGSFDTEHSILNESLGGTVVPSFVDETHAAIGSIGVKEQREALGPGLLQRVRLNSSLGSASVTVQLVINGTAVGSGVTQAIVANTGIDFDLPLAESEYSKNDRVSVGITGLASTSDTRVEALWSEGSPAP